MKYRYSLRVISVLVLLAMLLMPAANAGALVSKDLPPANMFQLPWDQGVAWVALDGLDNGTNRPLNSSHYYLSGGAVDFAPHNDMRVGENTSNAWVTADAAGTIMELGSCYLKIDHGNGWISEYQFIGNIQVKLGDVVYRNERLAIIADGVRLKFCAPDIEPGVPHLHFMLRPSIRNATFSGWVINYNSLADLTTFVKGNQALGLFKPLANVPNLQIVLRDPISWDKVYNGSVDPYLYEKWPFALSGPASFTLTATPITGGLTPLLILLDANGTELARGTGALTNTQPAGNYFVQIQPQTGSGFYQLLAHNNGSTLPGGPSVSTDVNPASIAIGDTAAVTVNINNIPADGYASAEITCTYNASLGEASTIVVTNLFGPDPAVAINGPQNGSFIVAIAGSNTNKATTSGAAFSFNIKGLQAGQTSINCTARVSTGDNVLNSIASIPASLTVLGSVPTATPTGAPATAASVLPTVTAIPSPTSTLVPASTGVLTGQVLAGKPVGVNLYDAGHTLVASTTTNTDGTFSLTAPAGTYSVAASAAGSLGAQRTVTLTAAGTSTLPTITLIAGDIDNSNVIDQFDAMTIGMSYNLAVPAAADLNGDGTINVLDLELLARNYGKTGPLTW